MKILKNYCMLKIYFFVRSSMRALLAFAVLNVLISHSQTNTFGDIIRTFP